MKISLSVIRGGEGIWGRNNILRSLLEKEDEEDEDEVG